MTAMTNLDLTASLNSNVPSLRISEVLDLNESISGGNSSRKEMKMSKNAIYA
jgi:hypothetical protein